MLPAWIIERIRDDERRREERRDEPQPLHLPLYDEPPQPQPERQPDPDEQPQRGVIVIDLRS